MKYLNYPACIHAHSDTFSQRPHRSRNPASDITMIRYAMWQAIQRKPSWSSNTNSTDCRVALREKLFGDNWCAKLPLRNLVDTQKWLHAFSVHKSSHVLNRSSAPNEWSVGGSMHMLLSRRWFMEYVCKTSVVTVSFWTAMLMLRNPDSECLLCPSPHTRTHALTRNSKRMVARRHQWAKG